MMPNERYNQKELNENECENKNDNNLKQNLTPVGKKHE